MSSPRWGGVDIHRRKLPGSPQCAVQNPGVLRCIRHAAARCDEAAEAATLLLLLLLLLQHPCGCCVLVLGRHSGGLGGSWEHLSQQGCKQAALPAAHGPSQRYQGAGWHR